MERTLHNPIATRADRGVYKHQMGLRAHMRPAQSVYSLAAEAGLNFGMGSTPMWVYDGDIPEDLADLDVRKFFVPSRPRGGPMRTAHWRTDTNVILSDHPGTYKLRAEGYGPIFEAANELFGETCTMALSLDNGARMYTLFQPAEPIDFGSGVLIPTVGIGASLDSSAATTVNVFASDPFCTNAFTSFSALMHTKATVNHDAVFVDRMTYLSAAVNRTRALANVARIACDQEFTDRQFEQMVASFGDVQEKARKASPVQDLSTGQWKDAHQTSVKNYHWLLDTLNEEWGKEKSRFGSTAWAAYNAVQGAEQHVLNGGRTGKDSRRKLAVLRKALFDPQHDLADEAWEYLRFADLVTV